MKYFFKDKTNKILFIISIISIFIYFSYEFTVDCPEWFLGADIIYEFFSLLSIAFISSFIFYVFQVYIPTKKKIDKVKSSIKGPLNKIIENLEELDNINVNTKMNSKSNSINLRNGKIIKLDYFEHIHSRFKEINNSCEKLYKNMIYLDENLILILNELYNSDVVYTFNLFYSMKESTDINIELKDIINLSEYCKCLELLRKYL